MKEIELVEVILLAVSFLIFFVLIVRDIRTRVKLKVLREGKNDLEQELAEVKKNLQNMEKTIPIELYALLQQGREQSQQMAPTYLPSAIMDMNTVHFTECIHSMQAKDIFEFINEILVVTVPCVYERSGIIDKFYKAGFTAFFDQNCENALTAAVSISERINQQTEKADIFDRFSIGLSYGTVLAGLAGTETRMSLITVSEYTGISSFLQSIGRKYNARILITGTFRERIEDFERKFNARRIGYIYITATGSLEEVYDVFDGELIQIRNNKRKTKMIFEKAVELYAKGDYETARKYFIEVFKTNRYDKVAKDYLHRCERNMFVQKTEKIEPQIETY